LPPSSRRATPPICPDLICDRRLRGTPTTSPDIRAGMAMLLAAVAAEGTSTINNADQIERGYRCQKLPENVIYLSFPFLA
jgi:hypothetical protein